MKEFLLSSEQPMCSNFNRPSVEAGLELAKKKYNKVTQTCKTVV